KVIGTSTCDILVAPNEDMDGKLVRGICGQVQGSVIPGMLGLEAGQSAFGDIYAWFKNLLAWPLRNILSEFDENLIPIVEERILRDLNQQAAQIELTEELEWAMDWWNGRRTPDANLLLTGSIHGLRLGSDAPRIFRALVEATAFGSKSIVERFISEGIPIKGLIALGGISRKSDFIMQVMADVIGMPIKVHRSEQTCAIGGAMFAATIAGVYPNIHEAMKSMGQGFDKEFYPDPDRQAIYQKRYEKYRNQSIGDRK
ncbi:MAG TPA: FGGY-family carbohydrate kinase, partial [Sphingobacteriaceae bacterium]|nr:FGGY-family carbohydrate kinase [Sphingobacteriaceae bacterium]